VSKPVDLDALEHYVRDVVVGGDPNPEEILELIAELRASRRVVEDLHRALRLTSPSAIYDLRRMAIAKAGEWAPEWWHQYPEGQMAAAFTRIMRILGPAPDGWHNIPWEETGKELPALTELEASK